MVCTESISSYGLTTIGDDYLDGMIQKTISLKLADPGMDEP